MSKRTPDFETRRELTDALRANRMLVAEDERLLATWMLQLNQLEAAKAELLADVAAAPDRLTRLRSLVVKIQDELDALDAASKTAKEAKPTSGVKRTDELVARIAAGDVSAIAELQAHLKV